MKSILFLVMPIFIIACSGNKAKDNGDRLVTPVADDSNTVTLNNSDNNSKHTLWIGLFAEWQRGAGGNIDGNYDTSNQIFIGCGDKGGEMVDRKDITLLSGSGCDQEPGNRVRIMMRIQKSKMFTQASSSIQITDTSKTNPKGTIKINNVEKTILFDQPSIDRIKKNPALLKTYYLKK